MRLRVFSPLLVLLIPALYLAHAIRVFPSNGSRLIVRDPGYYYLLSSLSLAEGSRAAYFAHPGAPLHIAGALVVAGYRATDPALDSRGSMLRAHARILAMLSAFAILANAFFLAFAAWLALKQSSWFAVLATQLTFFFVPEISSFLGYFQPEAFLISAGCCLWILFLLRRRYWFVLPAVAGTLISMKLFFLAYIASAFQWRSTKRVLHCVVFSGFFLAGWCLTVFSEPIQLVTYLQQHLLLSGAYARDGGNVGGQDLTLFSLFFRHFWQEHFSFTVTLFPLFLLATPSLFFRPRSLRSNRRLLSSLVVVAGSVALFLRQPTHVFYAMPAVAAAPAAYWCALTRLRKAKYAYLFHFTLLLPGLLFLAFFSSSAQYSGSGSSIEELERPLNEAIALRPGCALLVSGPVPHSVDALAMGAVWAAPSWLADLDQLYPLTFFTMPGDRVRGLQHTGSLGVPTSQWMAQLNARCILWASTNPRENLAETSPGTRPIALYSGAQYSVYFLDLVRSKGLKSIQGPNK